MWIDCEGRADDGAGGRLRSRCVVRLPAVLLAAVIVGCDAERSSGEDGAELGAPAALDVPAGIGSGQPHLAVSPTGEAVLSWLQPEGGGHALRFARLVDGRWSAPQTVVSSSDMFVNWADFPSVEPITADVWAAHWLKRAPDTYGSYDVAVSLSRDGGETWGDGFILNDDGALTEHGFVSLFPWGSDIGAVWLDGRRIAEQFELDEEFDANAPPVGMSLRYARLAFDGEVREQGELDELVCDCCQTDAASTGAGPVVVYRDRTPDEIRDHVVLRHTRAGWQPPVTLGPDDWRIEGCPVNGPAVAARGDEVAAAWFTAPGGDPRTRFARSSDGGATFGTPIAIDMVGSFGHVDVVLLEDGAAIVSWWRRGETIGTALMARRVEPGGGLGAARLVARNDSAQPLDVPQMVAVAGRLIFAWTDPGEAGVRSVAVPLEPDR